MRRFTCGMAAMLLLSAWLTALPTQAASAFADPHFQTQWQQGEAVVPNFWGPLSLARDGQREAYKEAASGQRLVQYFDKTRMELTNPASGTVTNGLLTVELKSGKMQLGDATFEQRQPAKVNIAGDPGNDGPTYADLAQLPERTEQIFSSNVFYAFDKKSGKFTGNHSGAHFPFTYVSSPDNRYGQFVYQIFYDFIKTLPLPMEQTTGYPISPVIDATVLIGGKPTSVEIQAFERRVLTYNLDTAAHRNTDTTLTGVEFGNIGQHYFTWRYESGAPAPPAPAATIPAVSSSYPGKIVYETGTGDTNASVYVMNADGSGKVKVGDGRSPLFSPDGKRIAFYASRSSPPGPPVFAAAIETTDLDGTNARDEVTFPTLSYDTLERWSPSGHYITINRTQNGPGVISLFDTTTGKIGDFLKYLQGTVSLIFDWTQDGNTALWQASKDFAGPHNLYFGDPETRGDGAAQLTHGENQIIRDTAHFYTSARISPDGKTIAVAGTKVFFLSVPGQVSPLDGKSLDGLSDVYSLSWSPDGRALAVARRLSSRRDDTGRSLSVVDIASGQVVTSVPGAGRADWSRQ